MSGSYLRPLWPAIPRVQAAFTLRGGGVSHGPYASFNLGAHVGDEPIAVAQNREALREQLELTGELLWLDQLHGSQLVEADALSPRALRPPRGDAAVSRRVGCALAVLVADCLPVLLAARSGSAVAVAHAGWRGLAAGVIEAAVGALAGQGALQAWLGPAIGPRHFEVGPEVHAAFVGRNPAAASAFEPNGRGRWQCDLQRLARDRLHSLGVEAVYADESCCYEDAQRFFSHRRDGATGRMAALIWLQPSP